MMPITGDNNPAGLPHPPYPPGFGAAMAAIAANQQFASLMTSQGLPFMPHAAIQAMYSSPTSKYLVASYNTSASTRTKTLRIRTTSGAIMILATSEVIKCQGVLRRQFLRSIMSLRRQSVYNNIIVSSTRHYIIGTIQ